MEPSPLMTRNLGTNCLPHFDCFRKQNKIKSSLQRRYLRKVNKKWKKDMEIYGVKEEDYIDDHGSFPM
jgi:hypothetical protein